MSKRNEYRIEVEAEKLLKEIRLGIRKAFNYFFVPPKKKDDKMIHLIELTAWIALTIALVLRIGRI